MEILVQLGRKKRRNVPLLKSLSYFIVKTAGLLDLKQLSDTLFALNQLSFKVCVIRLQTEFSIRIPFAVCLLQYP